MTEQQQSLKLENAQQIKAELNLEEAGGIHAKTGDDPQMDAKAKQLADALLNFDGNDNKKKDDIKAAVETMGYEMQREAAEQSEMLKQPMRVMMKRSEDGGEVAKTLIDLKLHVEELDPARYDFESGWFSRFMGKLPFVGTPLKRYFTKFESSQTIVDAIIKSLENGRESLKRDNITLQADQERMRELTKKIEKAIRLGQLLDTKITDRLETEIPADDPRAAFIKEEILFTLRQRVMDLQQQLAVNQQGVLASEIIIRNNKELIRGVNRALNVTVSALQVAVTVAMALENQKIVLEKVNAVSQTTNTLIANTAQRLKQQGTAIHKQAAGAQPNIDTLKQAFVDINDAMKDVAEFRTKALPQMAQSIVEMDRLTVEAEKTIKKMEKAKAAAPEIKIEIEP